VASIRDVDADASDLATHPTFVMGNFPEASNFNRFISDGKKFLKSQTSIGCFSNSTGSYVVVVHNHPEVSNLKPDYFSKSKASLVRVIPSPPLLVLTTSEWRVPALVATSGSH
jgi:hypothetical protein